MHKALGKTIINGIFTTSLNWCNLWTSEPSTVWQYDPEIEILHGTGFFAFLKVLVSIFTPWEPSFAVSPRRQWQRNTAPLTVASSSARKGIRNVRKTRNLGQLSGYSPWRHGLQCEGWLESIWGIVILKHQIILSWHLAHVSQVRCGYGLTSHPIIDHWCPLASIPVMSNPWQVIRGFKTQLVQGEINCLLDPRGVDDLEVRL